MALWHDMRIYTCMYVYIYIYTWTFVGFYVGTTIEGLPPFPSSYLKILYNMWGFLKLNPLSSQ